MHLLHVQYVPHELPCAVRVYLHLDVFSLLLASGQQVKLSETDNGSNVTFAYKVKARKRSNNKIIRTKLDNTIEVSSLQEISFDSLLEIK